MFNKKLNSVDITEVRKREEQINAYKLVVNALIIQKGIYLNQILPKYGCDMNKPYEIDLKKGIIKNVETKK